MTKGELHPGLDKQSDSEIDSFIRDTVHSGERHYPVLNEPCSTKQGKGMSL